MAQVPEELILEIMLWLPVKSILRFRCLSKSLCTVPDSPDFINSHLGKSSRNNNLHKLIFSDQSTKEVHVCDVNFDDLEEEDIIRLGNPVSSSEWNQVCGYCNGLLLLNRSSEIRPNKFGFELALWNPATRQYNRDLPFKTPPVNMEFCNVIWSGLGYDDSTDDYKVFSIVRVWQTRPFRLQVQVWIYGLKSNIWRRSQNFPYRMNSDSFTGIIGYFIDGVVYFLCKIFNNNNNRSYQSEIVAFDVRKETFSLVPQPDGSINSNPLRMELHVLEGCLYITYIYSTVRGLADIYIRKKNGVDQFTWTKLFCGENLLSNFDRYSSFNSLKVLGYSKGGDKMLIDLGLHYMVSYNPEEKSFRTVEIDKHGRNWRRPIPFLESLVSVGGVI